MLHPVKGEGPLIPMTVRVKEQAQMFPQGFLDAPILKEVMDPDRTKANWLANAWHLGVAELLVKQVLGSVSREGDLKEAGDAMKGKVMGLKWISRWGGSSLDQIELLIGAFGQDGRNQNDLGGQRPSETPPHGQE